MIEKMHRLSLLLFYTEKKRILRGLQELGVVDLDLLQTESPRIRRAAQDVVELKKSIAQIEKVRSELPKTAEVFDLEMPHELGAQLELVRKLLKEKDNLESAVNELADEYARYRHWGEIPVDGIALLAQKGIHVHLFSGSEKFFDRYDFGGHCVEVIARGGNTVRFALVTYHEDAPVIPFQKYAVPGRSLGEMQAEKQYLTKKLNAVHAKLAALYSGVGRLQNSAAHLETRRLFETAKHSLEADKTGTVYRITGYFPDSSAERVKRFLESHSLAYEITQPSAEEPVPVRLKNNRLGSLFEPITQIFSLPHYRELDPTPLFAPFFTLFFGFCMGDVGYGLLMLLVSLLLLRRRNLRGIGYLALILSAATIASGILMNSFFGANLFVRDGQGIFAAASDPAIFGAYTVQGKTVFPAMTLSLLVGCVQIFIAFVLQAVNETLVLGWRYGIKAAAKLLMAASAFILGAHADFLGLGFNSAFAIGPIQVGRHLTAVPVTAAQAMLALAFVLFFFVANPDRKIWLRPLAALWDFYAFATGLLGDFLSYIRLFALALAGGLLGNAFNQIAFMLLPQTPTGPDFFSPWLIATVLVLVVGHGLNFALGALGAFVHPLRLTFVEFYKNMNFRGGGRPYRPFRRVSSAA